jgi:hypothetical protein
VLNLLRDWVVSERDASTEDKSWGDKVAEGPCSAARGTTPSHRQEPLAVAKGFEEIATEFDGEDPAKPLVWGALERIRADLEELAENVQQRVGSLGPAEPVEEALDSLRSIARRASGDETVRLSASVP